MINIYIKKLEKVEYESKLPKMLKELKWKVIRIFNIIQIKQIGENRKIYLIPDPSRLKTYKRMSRKLENEKTKTEKIQIILSKDMKKYEEYFSKYKILNGKEIFYNSFQNILKKILPPNTIAMQNIYILTNYYKEKSINLIRNLAPKVMSVNVITKQIDKYKIIEEMLQEWGLSITVSNNKRKSLKNAKIIVNIDFSKEDLSKYIIYRNAIIINLTQEKLTNLKGFNGITIQDIRNRTK